MQEMCSIPGSGRSSGEGNGNPLQYSWGFSGGAEVKNLHLIPGSGRSPGRGHGNPLQYSCLENPTDRGSLAVHGVTKSWTWQQLNNKISLDKSITILIQFLLFLLMIWALSELETQVFIADSCPRVQWTASQWNWTHLERKSFWLSIQVTAARFLSNTGSSITLFFCESN